MNKSRETGLPQFNQFFILQSIVMEIITPPLPEVLALYDDVVFMPDYSELDFDKEWKVVRDSLREKLALKWKESCYGDADFLIGDDRMNSWTQAGSIQNPKMLSSHFSKTIFDVLNMSSHRDKWAVMFDIDYWNGLLKLKRVNVA